MCARKLRLALFQYNPGFYGDSAYLPYSAGMLWAYARSFPEIREAYEIAHFGFVREDPKAVVDQLENIDVVAFCTYLWNWQISNSVARGIRARFPEALIIFGGPQVPDDVEPLFATHPHIDLAVHGEGEHTFADILRERIGARAYASIPAVSVNAEGGMQRTSLKRTPVVDLDTLPSPYLSGVFDEVLKQPLKFQAIFETNRGCPYQCTFCYWGDVYLNKLRQFSVERVFDEIDWFGRNKIGWIYVADANFGIVERDVDIAKHLVATNTAHRYPKKFRANYAKNSTERVQRIARILNAQKMDKGITLSVQSLDPNVLKLIKRKNMRVESLGRFVRQYRREDISTYSELILGLPGESYDTWKQSFDKLLGAGAHTSLFVFNCIVLDGTEMSEPAYRKRHGTQTLRLPVTLAHVVPTPGIVDELEDVVIATRTMPHDAWKRAYMFSWAVLAFHTFGLTQVPAIVTHIYQRLGYADFYEELLEFARRHPETLLGQEYTTTWDSMEQGLAGRGFLQLVPEFSNITWVPEEASVLRISNDFDRFFDELRMFLVELRTRRDLTLDDALLEDIVRYQRSLHVRWDRSGAADFELGHSLHAFVRGQLDGRQVSLRRGRYRVHVEDATGMLGQKDRWAREMIFWGRRGGCPALDITVTELEATADLVPWSESGARTVRPLPLREDVASSDLPGEILSIDGLGFEAPLSCRVTHLAGDAASVRIDDPTVDMDVGDVIDLGAQLADGSSTRFSAVVRSVDLSVPTRAALEIIAS